MRWQIAIISTLWSQWFLLWAIGIQSLHRADSKAKAQAERRREVDGRLANIYGAHNQMMQAKAKANQGVKSLHHSFGSK